jgi:hypothetical protein
VVAPRPRQLSFELTKGIARPASLEPDAADDPGDPVARARNVTSARGKLGRLSDHALGLD